MKWLPHARSTAITVATSIHHFSRPLTRHRPRTKRKTVTAPIYIGPAVNGCGPQYKGMCFRVSLRFGCPALFNSFPVSESLSSSPEEDPPLKFGIRRFGISSIPYDHAVAYSRSSPLSLWLSLSADSSDPPRIVYGVYSYVGISLLAFVAIPIHPVTRSMADDAKKRPSCSLFSFLTHRFIRSAMAYTKITIAR